MVPDKNEKCLIDKNWKSYTVNVRGKFMWKIQGSFGK